MSTELTIKQKRFVDNYVTLGNASEAVIQAGYATKNKNRMGSKMLQQPKIKAAIDERLQEERERNELTADLVIQKLMNIVDATETDNPTAALRGLELLGKHLGLYRDRQEISGPDGGAIEMDQRQTESIQELHNSLDRLASRNKDNVVELKKHDAS